jgi:DNA-binding transcriptional LysR family regulator
MVIDRLDALQAFVLTVDRGSLASAPRGLGRSAASVTRAVASIERRLGTELPSTR